MRIPETVHILGFSKNISALRLAEDEVRRVGRTPVPFVNIASAWDSYCIHQLGSNILSGYMSRPSSFSCARGHYHIVQASLDVGDESVWVIEDDVRFLKDVDRMNDALRNAPKDADILILDPIFKDFHTEAESMAKASKAVNGWWPVEHDDVRSTGNYIMSAKAAKLYASILTRGPDGKRLDACDAVRSYAFFPHDIRIYAANPALSIQRKDEGSKHMQSFDKIYERYAAQGFSIGDYAEWRS